MRQAEKKYRQIIKEIPQSLEPIRGRGASWSPANRFEKLHVDVKDVDAVDVDPGDEPPSQSYGGPRERPRRSTQYFRDRTKTIITRNNSPDVGFETSVNPYRGCEHGCIYCYARPTHEYLGFSAGLDFESKIMVKMDAPELLRTELESLRWKPQVLVMSGVTDPYQPVEKKLRITRGCLEVLAKFRNPVAIITKNRLVTRDIDFLRELARYNAAAVNLSVTSLDSKLQRVLEPRTSSPETRLDAIRVLRAAGIPTGVMVAPIIPGLTDHEVPKILKACANAGAQFAGYTIIRLPWAVAPLFEHWLEEHFPDRKEKILGRIRDLRGNGRLNNSQWRTRMTGEGIFAEQIGSLFKIGCRRAGIGERPKLSTAAFRRTKEQLTLL
ncbi:MAG: radical SAM protein [Verrucomicrobia bacterium]|nr:MAG: radical SAM protein [Verrucomicrobiota bacterium]